MRKFLRGLSVLIVAVACAARVEGASIGMNFTATRFGGGPYPILPSETAGLVPQTNWNNSNPVANGSTADIASPLAGKLVNNTGADSGASIQWFNANAEVNSSGGNTTPNERLYRGTVEGDFFAPPDPQLAVSVSNIPYGQYDVIAYLAGFSFSTTASVQLGAQEFYYIQSSDFTTDGFIRATATSLGTATLATYAEFDNLTGSSFTITLNKLDGNRPAIAGLEIVSVPEPSGLSLAAIATLFCTAAVRWKRIRHS